MSKKTNRFNKILKILKISRVSSIKSLADTLKVSHMTVRRDIEILSKQNLIKIFHGSILLDTSEDVNEIGKYSLLKAASQMIDEKIRIGRKAAELIEPKNVIIFDTGSTVECAARYIPEELPMTAICYTLNVLIDVIRNKNCKIIFAGGYFHENTLMFESREGIDLIKRNRATRVFVSASGINIKLGLTCSNHYERDTKLAIMESSLQKILLADSSKFQKVESTYFADLKDFDILITDTGIPEEYRNYCANEGIELYIV